MPETAHQSIDPSFLAAVRRIRIMQLQLAIKPHDVTLQRKSRIAVVAPADRVGLCLSGAAAYPSTVLMTAVPAQAAGVKKSPLYGARRIRHAIPTSSPLAAGGIGESIGWAAACRLAYGVDGIAPWASRGPGQPLRRPGKRLVSGTVGIDMITRPTEVVVFPDASAIRITLPPI